MVTTPAINLTFEEYLTYDDGIGFHYELVDGKLELMNPPTIEHFSVLLLEEGLYEETVFTANQQIVSRTFPNLALTVEQVFAAGYLS